MGEEKALIRAFILPARQERYLEFLGTAKKRAKFIAQLAHFKHLDPRFAFAVSGNQRKPSELLKLLVGKGAPPKCWVISENTDLDGKQMELLSALRQTVGYGMGTFLCCVPGKLAYFEDEDGRYILER
jgi:hypothetical protein